MAVIRRVYSLGFEIVLVQDDVADAELFETVDRRLVRERAHALRRFRVGTRLVAAVAVDQGIPMVRRPVHEVRRQLPVLEWQFDEDRRILRAQKLVSVRHVRRNGFEAHRRRPEFKPESDQRGNEQGPAGLKPGDQSLERLEAETSQHGEAATGQNRKTGRGAKAVEQRHVQIQPACRAGRSTPARVRRRARRSPGRSTPIGSAAGPAPRPPAPIAIAPGNKWSSLPLNLQAVHPQSQFSCGAEM